MVIYLLQVTLCLSVFYAFYHFALKRETLFHTNRFYLLTTLIVSLILPFVKIYIDTLSLSSDLITAPSIYLESYIYSISETITRPSEPEAFPWGKWLMGFYLIGVAIMALRFLLAILEILKIKKNGMHTLIAGTKCVVSNNVKTPFSFLSTVYLPSDHCFQESELHEVLSHEMAHVNKRHTWDILLMEIICIILWPSPLVYLYRNAIKEVHEYVADAAVIKDTPWENYAQLLVSQQGHQLQNILSHQLIYSQLKKRLLMMNKERSGGWARIKYLGIIPILLLALVVFSFREKFNNYTTDVSIQKVSASSDTTTLYMLSADRYLLNSNELTFDQLENVLSEVIQKKSHPVFQVFVSESCKVEDLGRVDQLGSKLKSRVFFQTIDEESYPSGLLLSDRLESKPSGSGVQHTFSGDTLSDVYVSALRTINPINQTGYERQLPIFPGCETVAFADQGMCGMTKLGEYINANLIYPESVKIAGVAGKVIVKFVVGADGFIKDIAISESLHPDADEAVIQLMKNMNVKAGKWIPAGKEGKLVDAEMLLPIKFALDNTQPKSEPLKIVDEMARFPGCEHIENAEDRSNCAQSKLFEFIYSNIKYPKEDRDNNIQGTGILQFVVGPDGSLSEMNVVRAPSETIKAELNRVASAMAALPEKWIPAIKEGKPVAFQLTLPVRFQLQGETNKAKEDTKIDSNKPSLTIVPNPANSTISVNLFEGAKQLKIFDTTGRQVLSQALTGNASVATSIDISSLPPGQYVIQVQGDGGTWSGAFAIQR